MNEALKLITMFSLLGKHHYYLASDIATLMRTIREAAEQITCQRPVLRAGEFRLVECETCHNCTSRALILNATEEWK